MNAHTPVGKRPTNVSLDATLLAEARGLGVNISKACERGIAATVREAKEQAWLAENGEAIAYMNAWVEENGLPLGQYRRF